MFNSKINNRVFTQVEHARLAGMLALNWGNEKFLLPNIEQKKFVSGVTFHDRGYELLDTSPIGETDEAEWVAIQQRGFEKDRGDPVVDLLVKLQIVRLLSYSDKPERKPLIEGMQNEISRLIKDSRISEQTIYHADSITAFCDKLSFDICFEEPFEYEVSVFKREKEQVRVHCQRADESTIQLNPWPFGTEFVETFLIAYEQKGYPEKLTPELVPLRFLKKV